MKETVTDKNFSDKLSDCTGGNSGKISGNLLRDYFDEQKQSFRGAL